MSAKRTASSSPRKGAARKRPASGRASLERLAATSDEEIDAQIAGDPDVAPALDDDWFARADPMPPRATKVPISLRVDADVLQWYRVTGPRYQSRMNEVLRAYMKHQIERTTGKSPGSRVNEGTTRHKAAARRK